MLSTTLFLLSAIYFSNVATLRSRLLSWSVNNFRSIPRQRFANQLQSSQNILADPKNLATYVDIRKIGGCLVTSCVFLLTSVTSIIPISEAFATTVANAVFKTDSFAFSYPARFEESPKLLKTHGEETFLKSLDVKGFTIGVTVDKVKIDNIKSFKSPSELGDRVLSVEKDKEGFMDGKVNRVDEGFIASKLGGDVVNNPYYVVDYSVESTRGKNHYVAKATVIDKKLFVLTVQIKESDYLEYKESVEEVVNSLNIFSSLN